MEGDGSLTIVPEIHPKKVYTNEFSPFWTTALRITSKEVTGVTAGRFGIEIADPTGQICHFI